MLVHTPIVVRPNELKRVPKLWGEERWIVNNDLYCGKVLVLKRGMRCSLHYHKIKDETFYLVKGKVQMEVDGKVFIMERGDSMHIAVGSQHRFSGLEDSEIFEFSTHHEDSDSHRLEEGGLMPDSNARA